MKGRIKLREFAITTDMHVFGVSRLRPCVRVDFIAPMYSVILHAARLLARARGVSETHSSYSHIRQAGICAYACDHTHTHMKNLGDGVFDRDRDGSQVGRRRTFNLMNPLSKLKFGIP